MRPYFVSATESYLKKSPPPRSFPTSQPSFDEQQGRSILHRIGTAATAPVLLSDSDASKSCESDEESEWTKRSKIPRMRMYADEEEVRIERRKAKVQAQSKRKKNRDVRDYREKNSRSEDQERRQKISSSVHQESTRSEARNRDSSKWKSKTFESFDRDSMSRSHDDLRSRLGRDGKSKTKPGVSVTSTVWDRLNRHQADDTADWVQKSSGSDSDENYLQDEDLDSYADLRDSLLQGKKNSSRFEGGDLRSKLNLKKNMRQHIPMQKSPLRIEIDNDEYYRLIGSDQE
jgi:hypothetical protein